VWNTPILRKAEVMPFAHVIVPAGALSVAKKQKMIELVTDAIIAAEEAPPSIRPYVTVLVSETADGGWGIAGRGYTTAELGGLVASLAERTPR
jgi:phenylpyruvate tautomerase PptA (4-oxalocrotonate tautomerase family)